MMVRAKMWRLIPKRLQEAGRIVPRGPGRAARSPVGAERPPERLPRGCLQPAAALRVLLAAALQQRWGREAGCLQRGPAAGASAVSAALPVRWPETLERRPGCAWGVVRAGSGMVQSAMHFAAKGTTAKVNSRKALAWCVILQDFTCNRVPEDNRI